MKSQLIGRARHQAKRFWPVYVRLLKMSLRFWHFFLLGSLFAMAGGLLDGLIVWLLKPIVDQGFVHRNVHFIRWLPALILGIGGMRGLMACASKYFTARTGNSMIFTLRSALFGQLLRMPMSHFEREDIGSMVSLFGYNISQFGFTATQTLSTAIRELSVLLGIVVAMFALNWKLSSLFFVIMPPLFFLVRYCAARLKRLNIAQQDAMASATTTFEENLRNMALVRSHGLQSFVQNRFHCLLLRKLKGELKTVVTDALGSFGVQFLMTIPLAMTLFLATMPNWKISAGTFTALISSMLALRMPVQRLSALNGQLQSGIAAAESIFDVLDQAVEPDFGRHVFNQPATGNILFDEVSFVYDDGSRPAVSEFSLNIAPGEMVALVGASGAGKSTIMKLLQRFYAPTSGQLSIDGRPIADYQLASLRSQFAVVSQDIQLFNATVAENITYGMTDVAKDDIIAAACMANAWEFIEALPDGLATVVGPRGVKLSGGQKQRIVIARAFMLNRPILLLDEATSSLDAISESQVRDAIARLLSRVTAIVIAHRLSTVKHADRIVVMQEGRIAEVGTHTELLVKQGIYAHLHDLHDGSDHAAP